jgi:hypothetical protein
VSQTNTIAETNANVREGYPLPLILFNILQTMPLKNGRRKITEMLLLIM